MCKKKRRVGRREETVKRRGGWRLRSIEATGFHPYKTRIIIGSLSSPFREKYGWGEPLWRCNHRPLYADWMTRSGYDSGRWKAVRNQIPFQEFAELLHHDPQIESSCWPLSNICPERSLVIETRSRIRGVELFQNFRRRLFLNRIVGYNNNEYFWEFETLMNKCSFLNNLFSSIIYRSRMCW